MEGFRKTGFFKKILPDTRLMHAAWSQNRDVFWNCLGGDFFKNPQGLNLFFWIPATYLCFLFLFFWFCNLTGNVFIQSEFNWEWGFLGLFFLADAFFGQGSRFLFAYRGCCDWFLEKLMPRVVKRRHNYQVNNQMLLRNGMGIGFS